MLQVHFVFCTTKEIPRFDAKSIESKETTKVAMQFREEILKVDYPAYGNSSSEKKVGIDGVNRIEVQ